MVARYIGTSLAIVGMWAVVGATILFAQERSSNFIIGLAVIIFFGSVIIGEAGFKIRGRCPLCPHCIQAKKDEDDEAE